MSAFDLAQVGNFIQHQTFTGPTSAVQAYKGQLTLAVSLQHL